MMVINDHNSWLTKSIIKPHNCLWFHSNKSPMQSPMKSPCFETPIWLVVWNMFSFSIQLGRIIPNWRTPSFFRGVGQPPTSLLMTIY